jgi:DNA-binding transcriptional LysR family regulator
MSARQFDDLSLGSLELFCLAAELESFTAAAAAAGVTPPAVSRTVARLEAKLGARLLARSTRRVRLTDSGRAYHAQCREALAQLGEAARLLGGEQAQPVGTVRISLPTSYAHHRVLPLLADFRRLHPGIELELQLSNRNVDLVGEGFDLAVRGRTPPDSGLVARPLEDAALVIVGSPRYLRRRGRPRDLAALAQHECIHFVLPRTGQLVPWLLKLDGQLVERTLPGAIRCTDDILGPVTLARHDAGLVQTYRFVVEAELAEGSLREVLPQCAGASRPFSLLYPAQRHRPARVRAVIDFLVERLARHQAPARTAAAPDALK